jgi:rhamnulose-1-phosphate aldolase/alcohol dehydrogenase
MAGECRPDDRPVVMVGGRRSALRGNLWDESAAPPEGRPLEVLVYRSRLIGADPDLVVWGGGNTSVKTQEPDHLGRIREVLRVKGSGTDLKTIHQSGFPGIFRADVLPLLERADMSDEEMVAYLEHCMVEPSGPRPSIETLLHAFLPARHVDHVHADAIVALTNTEHGREVVLEALGEGVAYVPYRRPGFLLAKEVYAAARSAEPPEGARPGTRLRVSVVLAKHGLVTWGETGEQSYRTTIELVERAERYLATKKRGRSHRGSGGAAADISAIRPRADLTTLLLRLRGRLGHVILRLHSERRYREIADRPDVHELAAAGPATPDHILRIRPWACVLDDDPAAKVDAYEEKYRAYFSRYAKPSLSMLDPRPKVFLIPGIGMVTAGRDAKDARITGEVAWHTLRVAAHAKDAQGSYESISENDVFDIDYWPLELRKLTLLPAPREFEGRVMIVTGAASGIGRATARYLASMGAQMVLLDLNSSEVAKTASLIMVEGGMQPLAITVDLTDAAAVADAVRTIVQTYGGIDALVSNAGIPAGGTLMDLSPEEWRRSMEVNATSHFLITSEVMKAMAASGLGGSIVYIASKNAFGPGAGFGAYSAAKAAEVQLARIVALEGGPLKIRSNIVNPDAVFEDSGLWSDEVKAQRAAAHGVPVEELEQFYAQRNLLKTTISGRDVAEAVAFLVSDRSKTTTGTVIAVDGGVAAAFPR